MFRAACPNFRSGEEGFYPELIEFTEERLKKVNPKRWDNLHGDNSNDDDDDDDDDENNDDDNDSGSGECIFGDPGVDKGGEGKSKRVEKYIWNEEK